MSLSERDQRGISRAQRMLEEENRQLMQEIRLLRDQKKQLEDKQKEQTQQTHHVINPTDMSHVPGHIQTDSDMTLQTQQTHHVINPTDMSHVPGHIQTDSDMTLQTQQSHSVIDTEENSRMGEPMHAEARLAQASLVSRTPHVISSDKISHVTEHASRDGETDQFLQNTQERKLSDNVDADYHSPGITLSDWTEEKNVGVKKKQPHIFDDSKFNVGSRKESTTTEKFTSSSMDAEERTGKDKISDSLEIERIDRNPLFQFDPLYDMDTKQQSVQEEIDEESGACYGGGINELDAHEIGKIDGDHFGNSFEIEGEESDQEQKDMSERLQKLELEEAILDKENAERAKVGAELMERVKQMKAKAAALHVERQKANRWSEMMQEQERREKRLQLKIKKQREDDEMIRKLQQEEDRLVRIERMKQEEIKHQRLLELKVKEQKEHEEKIRVLEEEERKYQLWLANELKEKRQFEQYKMERKREDMHINVLKQEYEILPRQMQETDVGPNQHIDHSITLQHVSEQSHSDRTELEWLRDRVVSLEKQVQEVQEKEQSDSLCSSMPSKMVELTKKEAYLKDLEKALNRKEEEIRQNLKVGQTSEENTKTGSVPKKDELAQYMGFSPYKPNLCRFSGMDPVPKSESSFEGWKLEVDCLIGSKMYPDHIINQLIRNSLSGQARTVIVTLGPKVTNQEIIDKLESVFGNVATGASIMQEFYTAAQNADESVTLWGIRIEQIVQRAVEKGYISPEQKDTMLKDRFWWYLRNVDLRNTSKIHYVQAENFDMLRSKVKAEEHAMAVHERGEIPPLTKREEKSKSSIAVQHQPLLQDSNSKLLKEIMEKVEKLDIKVENMSKGGKGKWWPKQKQEEKANGAKGAKETGQKSSLNG